MATKAKEPADKTPTPAVEIIAYKGFSTDMTCRDFQYEMGKTFAHDGEVKHCKSGFHACENPLDTFNYYAPGTSKFAIVKMTGSVSRETDGDSKIASASITIDAELTIPVIVSKAIELVTALCKPDAVQHATGYRSASSATGDQSASSATGDQSASSATGKNAVAMNIGVFGKAKASKDGAIVLCSHDDCGNLLHIKASRVGDNGIKPDVFYTLSKDGEFIKE